MREINIQYFDTSYGALILGAFGEELCLCDWQYRKKRTAVDARIQKGLEANFVEKDDAILQEARKQLNEYFKRERKIFNIPLRLVGSTFQKRVWESLLKVPYGKTSSYLQLAHSMGNKKAVRAVASANGANAISIIVPCHRIVGSNGKLVGYAAGTKVKAKLLELEFDLFSDLV